MKDIRIRFYPLSRAFPNFYGFGGSDPRVSVDGRPKRIKNYTDSNESALVWTGPKTRFENGVDYFVNTLKQFASNSNRTPDDRHVAYNVSTQCTLKLCDSM